MENNPGGEPQQKRFILSDGATETLGAALFLTVIGLMGYTLYIWIWSLAH